MVNWETFSEEEVKALQANPYVKSVTAKMIRFTVAFKEEFWRRNQEECPVKIMRELGFDVDVLGEKRIRGIICSISVSKQRVAMALVRFARYMTDKQKANQSFRHRNQFSRCNIGWHI